MNDAVPDSAASGYRHRVIKVELVGQSHYFVAQRTGLADGKG
jgi:hypothetical protein